MLGLVTQVSIEMLSFLFNLLIIYYSISTEIKPYSEEKMLAVRRGGGGHHITLAELPLPPQHLSQCSRTPMIYITRYIFTSVLEYSVKNSPIIQL